MVLIKSRCFPSAFPRLARLWLAAFLTVWGNQEHRDCRLCAAWLQQPLPALATCYCRLNPLAESRLISSSSSSMEAACAFSKGDRSTTQAGV